MDQETDLQVKPFPAAAAPMSAPPQKRVSRRGVLKYGLYGLAGTACCGAAAYYLTRRAKSVAGSAEIFPGDAPQGRLWQQWQKQGWVKEAQHYLQLGDNVLCKLCPNECLLGPEDRSHCRNRVCKDGKLYTLAYGNPCAFSVDPVEKKPLFHFLPETRIFSLATSGCGFRCLNCQNWDISQRKPEETKDPRGEPLRLDPQRLRGISRDDFDHLSMFPDDVVALTRHFECPSIAYTYSEPIVWYEYMLDIAKAARSAKIKSACVTCGFIHEEPLVELCRYIDAASVNLKSFSEDIYRDLNSGKLEPILSTLKILKREGVWFEVINLIVPTYTDKPDMIRQMCDWLVENLGPDYPLHFSRFMPQHKLTHLSPTPVEVLSEARSIAIEAGLRYVYVGNCSVVPDGETTFCPQCKKPVVERKVYSVEKIDVVDGKCRSCGAEIAGVWSAEKGGLAPSPRSASPVETACGDGACPPSSFRF